VEYGEVLRRRRMVRHFTGAPVAAGSRDRILASAVRGPSAGFSQGWAFLVLEGPEQTGRYWRAAGADPDRPTDWLAGLLPAPLLVLPLSSQQVYLDRYAEPDKGWTDRDPGRWLVPYWHVDAGMSALLMLMTAVDEGLGACFFGVPPGELGPVRAEFGIPAEWVPVGALTIGHPDPNRASRPSRPHQPTADAMHFGDW
jgi:nitroreductase